jgi:ubiquinone/menaquinone biosynthesis C-methylase UbiE
MGMVARQRGAEVIQAVAEALPFVNESFDFALMVTTLCFLNDVDVSFQEAYRVIKRGGSLIVGFVDRESPLGKAYQSRKNKSLFYRAARFYAVEEVVSSMERAGFERFAFAQTIFQDLHRLRSPETVRQGHGEGSFVVLRGTKPGGARLETRD